MNKKRLLFVDDEPNILSGLRRMLRSLRNEYAMDFAEGGQEALEKMHATPFDVIVSDMRMPGMDGATLLTEIQHQFPHAIRIMLSGQADEESVLRTVGVVHQFLAKPCDPDTLKNVIGRACTLHGLISDGGVKDFVSGLGTLPSLPTVYVELQRLLHDPKTSVNEVAAVIERDLAMSAKVLQLVNSSFFGLFQTVESPARAVSLLGLDTITALALSVKVFSELRLPKELFSMETLWEHSMAIATCAKKIAAAETEDQHIINSSFIGGILHDIGKLVLMSHMAEEYVKVISLTEQQGLSSTQAEEQIFHVSHCKVGAYLTGLWGLPAPVVEAIGFHHHLRELPTDSFMPALAVHVANVFYYTTEDTQLAGTPPVLDTSYIEQMGLADRIETWQDLCREILEQRDNDQ